MKTETRLVYYDTELEIEAYYLKGIVQKFPNHFHEDYVIGYIESGQRYAYCKGQKYVVRPGDLIIFNPHDTHACEQVGEFPLDWRCINVRPEIMTKIAFEITGKEFLPYFNQTVDFDSDLVPLLRELHTMIVQAEKDFQKEEVFFLFMEQLMDDFIGTCGISQLHTEINESHEIKIVCEYLEENYTNTISLEELCQITGFSKSYLLRSFTKQKGISPYRYLETIRIDKAKKLLQNGMKPIYVAMETGFSDQSHFTNFFKNLIGLTPRQYMDIFKDHK